MSKKIDLKEFRVKKMLGDRYSEYKRILEIVKNKKDIREMKIEFLKKAIREGRYKIDAEKIADKIIQKHFQREIF